MSKDAFRKVEDHAHRVVQGGGLHVVVEESTGLELRQSGVEAVLRSQDRAMMFALST